MMYRLLLPIVLLLPTNSVHSATLTIEVLRPDGKPAENVPVHGIRLLWRSPKEEVLGKTDINGRFTVSFNDDQGEPAPLIFPDEIAYSKYPEKKGYGIYRFILTPDQYSWKLSDSYYWNHPDLWHAKGSEIHGSYILGNYDDQVKINQNPQPGQDSNWNYGQVILVHPDESLTWKVQLNEREKQRIAVRDQFNAPVPYMQLDVYLGFGFHYGGLDIGSVCTDEQGHFELDWVEDFTYSFITDAYFQYYAPDQPFRTGRIDTKITGDHPVIRFKKSTGTPITIFAIEKETGEPAADTTIITVMDFENIRQGGPYGKTGPDGCFHEEHFNPEHVASFGVFKEGYEECRWLDISQYTPGGEYCFELIKKKGGDSK
ncbi:MAG: hypothetical protein ACE15F_13480 [bacterium]